MKRKVLRDKKATVRRRKYKLLTYGQIHTAEVHNLALIAVEKSIMVLAALHQDMDWEQARDPGMKREMEAAILACRAAIGAKGT